MCFLHSFTASPPFSRVDPQVSSHYYEWVFSCSLFIISLLVLCVWGPIMSHSQWHRALMNPKMSLCLALYTLFSYLHFNTALERASPKHRNLELYKIKGYLLWKLRRPNPTAVSGEFDDHFFPGSVLFQGNLDDWHRQGIMEFSGKNKNSFL